MSQDSNKKRIVQKGYNKKVHEEALYFSNSRPSKQSTEPQAGPSLPRPSQILQNNNSRLSPHLPINSAPQDSYNDQIISEFISFWQLASERDKDVLKEILFPRQNPCPYWDKDQMSDS